MESEKLMMSLIFCVALLGLVFGVLAFSQNESHTHTSRLFTGTQLTTTTTNRSLATTTTSTAADHVSIQASTPSRTIDLNQWSITGASTDYLSIDEIIVNSNFEICHIVGQLTLSWQATANSPQPFIENLALIFGSINLSQNASIRLSGSYRISSGSTRTEGYIHGDGIMIAGQTNMTGSMSAYLVRTGDSQVGAVQSTITLEFNVFTDYVIKGSV